VLHSGKLRGIRAAVDRRAKVFASIDRLSMAREEADREDLLGEATAYVERIEWELDLPDLADATVFAGFRRDGAASFYFGSDHVYHFNAAGELRRAFHQGRLVKAERGRLVGMQRERSDTEVSLVSTEFSAAEAASFCQKTTRELSTLLAALQNHKAKLKGQVPAIEPIEQRVISWLMSHPVIAIAKNARAGG
jgi:hypothetical protein